MFLISSTNDSLREIEDNWDLPRLDKWVEYCGKNPPLQAMVAAYLGFNKKEAAEPFRVTEQNFDVFCKMLSSGSLQ